MRVHALFGPLVVLAIWVTVAAFSLVSPVIVPSPWRVAGSFAKLTTDGLLLVDLGATTYRTLVAFGLSAVLGIALGIPLGVWRLFHASAQAVIDFLRSLPSPALIPLAILFFGLGDAARIAVATFTCLLINAVQVAHAVTSIPRQRVLAARLAGAQRAFLLKEVLIPSILPGLINGWRITISISLIVIIVTEMFIGTRYGLGMRINDLHLMLRTSDMYAYILVVGSLGYVLNLCLETLERKLVHWKGSWP